MTKYKTQYAIVGKLGRKECESAVKTFIEAGWFPLGGIAVDRDYFTQAMSRSVPITEADTAHDGQETGND